MRLASSCTHNGSEYAGAYRDNGPGGMGIACVRCMGSGRIVVLADKPQDTRDRVTPCLELDGYTIELHIVDNLTRPKLQSSSRSLLTC